MSEDTLDTSISACTKCVEACQVFAEVCLLQIYTGRDELPRVAALKACRDCLDICRLWLLLKQQNDPNYLRLCRVCASLCRRCAEACAALEDYSAQSCNCSSLACARTMEMLSRSQSKSATDLRETPAESPLFRPFESRAFLPEDPPMAPPMPLSG
ncbi:MAG: hypothetical protein ACAI44_30850 [Candidatus Sericytochromatia bacterium]